MIDHTGINVSSLAASKAFYLATLSALGYEARKEMDDIVIFGSRQRTEGEDPAGDFYIAAGDVLSPRSHVAFRAKSRADVEAFHQAALAAGGRSNGAPGLRPQYHENYYAAFVLDPDGYNVEAVCHMAP
jgi:catechol 2,3-dioxygenase-like lactoylglutathione lyase family enzyme